MINVVRSFQRNDVRLISAGSFLIGAGVGSYATRVLLYKRYLALVDFQVAEVKESYARKYKDGPFSTPEGAAAVLLGGEKVEVTAEALQDAIEANRYAFEEEVENPENSVVRTVIQDHVPVEQNVFDSAYQARVEEAEEIGTVPAEGRPYSISVSEFHNENPHYDKITLTYWEGDNTLADDQESPVIDIENTIGLDALEMFGIRSNDPNITYVRNDDVSADFEVIRDARKYGVVVAGFDDTELEPHERIRRPDRIDRANRDD